MRGNAGRYGRTTSFDPHCAGCLPLAATLLRRRAEYLVAVLALVIGPGALAGLLENDARKSAATAQTSAHVAYARSWQPPRD